MSDILQDAAFGFWFCFFLFPEKCSFIVCDLFLQKVMPCETENFSD